MTALLRPPRGKQPTPALPLRINQVIPAQAPRDRRESTTPPARNVHDGIATPNTGVGVRGVSLPARVRTITIPPLAIPSGSGGAPRTVPSLAPPPPTIAAPVTGGVAEAVTSSPGGPAAAPPRTNPATSPPARGVPATSPPPHGGRATEPPPSPAFDEFGLPSDTMPSMPAMQSSEPIVRSRAPTSSPLEVTPALKPGQEARRVTPATELFAEPEPGGDGEPAAARTRAASAHGLQRPPSGIMATDAVPPGRAGLRRVLIVVLVLVLAGGGATAAALYLSRYREPAAERKEPPPPGGKTTGTVKFAIVPSDSAVTIEGKPMHLGSPWQVELAPGVHQIEIHHEGYKGWLTSIDLVAGELEVLRVVLDPLSSGAIADATLIVASTPPALEAVLDGTPLATRTPIKVAIKAGPHTIILRMTGVDVWTQPFDARASAVYEFNPTIADRARAAPPPRPAPR